MGTPDFALEALKAIHGSGHDVTCVYSQPPRAKGRGHKLTPSPVHAYAQEHNIPVFHPVSLKSEDVQAEFKSHNLDIAIVAAYGLLLPKAVLEAPKYGCINIHASLLPRWRGASPIQQAIWQGDEETGVTIMQMDEGLDTGPEITKQAIAITERETAGSLHDKLANLGAKMCLDTLDKLAKNDQLKSETQSDQGVTYARLLKKSDGKIDWNMPANVIDRQVRALNPWPGTWTNIGEDRLKIISAEIGNIQAEKNQPVGIILDKKGHVQCDDGSLLKVTTIQPAGKSKMDFASALNGGYVQVGQHLS